jgi:hypothetical protein
MTKPSGAKPMQIVPISFADACAFVAEHHRHHKPPIGHKFSIGCASEDQLVGVAIVGRPVSRVLAADGMTLEVNRTATDGTPNANSMLYGAAWQAAKALGYSRLITYTQENESGSSLRGSGFQVIGQRAPRAGWSAPSRPRSNQGNEYTARTLWERSE